MTAHEVAGVLQQAAALDELIHDALNDGRLTSMSTGSDLPVMDLYAVSEEFLRACERADLVVFEGMGRGIETTLELTATGMCILNIGMVKHKRIAELMGCELFDCICHFKMPARTMEEESGIEGPSGLTLGS